MRRLRYAILPRNLHSKQRGQSGDGNAREKDAKLIANARTAPAHVANLARGFWSPEHHHEESKASLVHRQTFDRTHSRVDVPRKGYDREKAGGLKGSMGGKEKTTKEERRSKRSAESGGTRGIASPTLDSPGAHPLPPLFSYPLAHSLPRATPLDHSRHSSLAAPAPSLLRALHLSLSSPFTALVLPTLFLALRHSLPHASTSCVPPNGVTYFAPAAANVRAVAQLLLTVEN